jgi:hypothetical protein
MSSALKPNILGIYIQKKIAFWLDMSREPDHYEINCVTKKISLFRDSLSLEFNYKD